MKVEISKIKVGTRIRKDLGDISELADSIKRYGLLSPITITRLKDDKYKLLVGNRRLQAHIKN